MAAALVLLHVTVAWIARAPAILTGQDDARYLGLARALLAGSYRDFMFVGAPLHHMYPPGYPALLAVWTRLGGEQFDWMVGLQVAMSALMLTLLYAAATRTLGTLIALAALFLAAINPDLIFFAGQLDSEVGLALCVSVVVWASVGLPDGRVRSALLLTFATLAPLMRLAGVTVPIALVVYWLIQRRTAEAVIASIVSAAVLGPLLWWTFKDPASIQGFSYVGDLYFKVKPDPQGRFHIAFMLEQLNRIKRNAVFYPTIGFPWVLPMPTVAGTIIDNVIGSLLIAAMTVAGLVRIAQRIPLAAIVVLCYSALLLCWSYSEPRFLEPYLPLLLLCLMAGAVDLAQRVNTKWTGAVAGVVVTIVGVTALAHVSKAITAYPDCRRGDGIPSAQCLDPERASFFAAAEFINARLPQSARILSAKAEPLAIYTRRLTVPYQRLAYADSATLWATLQRDSTNFILLNHLHWSERHRLSTRLAERCRELRLVGNFPPSSYLFQLERTEAAADAVPGHVNAADSAAGSACAVLAKYRAAYDTR